MVADPTSVQLNFEWRFFGFAPGYGVVAQQGDGSLKISIFDIGNALQDSFSVGPNS
jgi:hypothetical protein